MIRCIGYLACLLALEGCAAQQRQARYDAAAAECHASIPAAIGNYVKLETCLNEAARNAEFKGAAEDLREATRIELAEKIDRGEITKAEASAQFRPAEVRSPAIRSRPTNGQGPGRRSDTQRNASTTACDAISALCEVPSALAPICLAVEIGVRYGGLLCDGSWGGCSV